MTVTVYRSTDSGAPVLTGQAGSLITLLDAILVNGYGSKTPQGWTKPFNGANQAVYRSGAGNQRYLNVIDDGATTAGAGAYARVYGMETATAQNTGTGLFPSTAQQSSPGLYAIKSLTSDSTARAWWAYGNGKLLHLFVSTDGNSSNPLLGHIHFGDFTSVVPSDAYNTCISASDVSNPTQGQSYSTNLFLVSNFGNTSGYPKGTFLARDYTGLGSSKRYNQYTNSGLYYMPAQYGPLGAAQDGGSNAVVALPYPNPDDSGLYLERVFIGDGGQRGYLDGMWAPMHGRPLTHLDTFSGTGTLAGKTFEALGLATQYGPGGQVFMETSNTW